MTNDNKYEVTGFPMWQVLQALYEGRRKYWTEQPKMGNPAVLLRLMAMTKGQPQQADYEEGLLESGAIPDYFRGSPMKVTTEWYTNDMERVWVDNPNATRTFIGRLDLFDRDNGQGSAVKALKKLTGSSV